MRKSEYLEWVKEIRETPGLPPFQVHRAKATLITWWEDKVIEYLKKEGGVDLWGDARKGLGFVFQEIDIGVEGGITVEQRDGTKSKSPHRTFFVNKSDILEKDLP